MLSSADSPYLQLLSRVLPLAEPVRRIPVDRVREMLDYNPSTGVLTWRHRSGGSRADRAFNGKYAGRIAGCKADGEIVVNIRIDGKQYGFRAHHLAWVIQTGEWPSSLLDHENGNSHDNSWENLREADHSGNNANRHIIRGSSRFKGVARFKDRWSAACTYGGRQHWIGVFNIEEDAARAYDQLSSELHGPFAKTNAALGLL